LEATSDSLTGSSMLRKGPVTAWRVWNEHLKSSAPQATENDTNEIGSVLYNVKARVNQHPPVHQRGWMVHR
jgi:hypothetical protein